MKNVVVWDVALCVDLALTDVSVPTRGLILP
jgi:hypothetical protein